MEKRRRDQDARGKADEVRGVTVPPAGEPAYGQDPGGGDRSCEDTGRERRPESVFRHDLTPIVGPL